MSSRTPPKVILGTHTIGDAAANPGICHFDTREDVLALLDAFKGRGHTDIDTASNYPGSEIRLGDVGAASNFTIHTKVRDGQPGAHEPAKIKSSLDQSLRDLKTPGVDTFFLHVPDRQTPFEDIVKAMDEAFQEGKFKRFGVSNYSADEVAKIIGICEQHGYVKPSVYQGHYNTVVRRNEEELFPLLRKHKMSFFAYSPAAGGFFSSSDKNTASSRWSNETMIGQIYNYHYSHPAVHASVKTVRDAAEKHGISAHAAALRWTAFHSQLDGSHGDGLIFSASKMEQLEKNLTALEAGALPADLAEALSSVYATFEGNGPGYHL